MRSWVVWLLFACLALAAVALGVYAFNRMDYAVVQIEWSTASELDTVGFNVYRADTPDGSLQKVNENLIPASSDPQAGGDYSFIDSGVIPGKQYYYYLEDVNAMGNVGRHGPQEVTAQGGGMAELALAVLMLAVAVLGFLSLRPVHKGAQLQNTGRAVPSGEDR